jgi:hypothetical protein
MREEKCSQHFGRKIGMEENYSKDIGIDGRKIFKQILTLCSHI